MNEFVVILKLINFKNGKLKKNWNFEKFQNSMVIKKFSHSQNNLFILNTPKKQSKRIIETEPTRWLQSKNPWKSEWIRHFN